MIKPRGQLSYAGRVRPNDLVFDALGLGDGVRVTVVVNAPGRKPPTGQNLHLRNGFGATLKVNTTDIVRIDRRASVPDTQPRQA